MLRCAGVLAGHAKARAEVVPGRNHQAGEQLGLLDVTGAVEHEPKPAAPSRHRWAWLLARVFAADLNECPDCGGRMRLLAVVTDRADIERILRGQSAAARAPPHPAQLELDFRAA